MLNRLLSCVETLQKLFTTPKVGQQAVVGNVGFLLGNKIFLPLQTKSWHCLSLSING